DSIYCAIPTGDATQPATAISQVQMRLQRGPGSSGTYVRYQATLQLHASSFPSFCTCGTGSTPNLGGFEHGLAVIDANCGSCFLFNSTAAVNVSVESTNVTDLTERELRVKTISVFSP